jgi:hypothetical protein
MRPRHLLASHHAHLLVSKVVLVLLILLHVPMRLALRSATND